MYEKFDKTSSHERDLIKFIKKLYFLNSEEKDNSSNFPLKIDLIWIFITTSEKSLVYGTYDADYYHRNLQRFRIHSKGG